MKKFTRTILLIVIFLALYFLYSQQSTNYVNAQATTQATCSLNGQDCTLLNCCSGLTCAQSSLPYKTCQSGIQTCQTTKVGDLVGNCANGTICATKGDLSQDCTILGKCQGTCQKVDPSMSTEPPPSKDPPPPPCAEFKNKVCIRVNTSLPGLDSEIDTDPAAFVTRIFAIVLSFAGGIALLLIISAGYKIMTSRGNPEKIQAGREQLISAIVGLVFIIFSFVIFQLIVADILKIPGLTPPAP